jgi:putative membrane protein
LTLATGFLLAAVLPGLGQALAHGNAHSPGAAWTAWNLTPDIMLGTFLVTALYIAGMWRRHNNTDSGEAWRHLSYFSGILAVFVALESPVDPIAEHVFMVHQVQHLLLRTLGPMLLVLAAPQGLLVAGMPDALRRRILAPAITGSAVKSVFAFLARPVVATGLYIGTLYFWQIPRFHQLSLLSARLHYLMHATMLFAGLLFFWRVFDTRPAPMGLRYGLRLMMLWVMVLSNIVLGAYLVFKDSVLYPVYGELGRWMGFSALGDEVAGGMLIWVPGSMMGVLAVLIVIHRWGRQETKDERRRAATRQRQGKGHPAPMTASELVRETSARNRAMALGFLGFAIAVFAITIAVGVVSELWG